jgi:hypothetical protein
LERANTPDTPSENGKDAKDGGGKDKGKDKDKDKMVELQKMGPRKTGCDGAEMDWGADDMC